MFDTEENPIPRDVALNFFSGLKTLGIAEGSRWNENFKAAMEVGPEGEESEAGSAALQIAKYKRLAAAMLTYRVCGEVFESTRIGRDRHELGCFDPWSVGSAIRALLEKTVSLGGDPQLPEIEQPPTGIVDEAGQKDHMQTLSERMRVMLLDVLSTEELGGLRVSLERVLEEQDRMFHSQRAKENLVTAGAISDKTAAEGAAEPLMQQNTVQEYPDLSADQIAAEQAVGDAEQARAEADFLRNRLQQSEQARQVTEAQASEAIQTTEAHAAQQQDLMAQQLEQAQVQAQDAGMQLEQAQGEAAEAGLKAQENLEQAVLAEENAAAQAEGKMRAQIVVQQMRQSLADMASSDPLITEGLATGQEAGPGGAGPIMTAHQQAAATVQDPEEAMAQEQAAAEDAVVEGSPDVVEEKAEADRAQMNANKQKQQVQISKAEEAAKQQAPQGV